MCRNPTHPGAGWIAQKRIKFLITYITYSIIYMANNYRHTNTIVSLINYYFVFCPRYKRKFFNSKYMLPAKGGRMEDYYG